MARDLDDPQFARISATPSPTGADLTLLTGQRSEPRSLRRDPQVHFDMSRVIRLRHGRSSAPESHDGSRPAWTASRVPSDDRALARRLGRSASRGMPVRMRRGRASCVGSRRTAGRSAASPDRRLPSAHAHSSVVAVRGPLIGPMCAHAERLTRRPNELDRRQRPADPIGPPGQRPRPRARPWHATSATVSARHRLKQAAHRAQVRHRARSADLATAISSRARPVAKPRCRWRLRPEASAVAGVDHGAHRVTATDGCRIGRGVSDNRDSVHYREPVPRPAAAATTTRSASSTATPDMEMAEAEERGEIRLGGCLIGPESPDFECRGCGVALPWVAD